MAAGATAPAKQTSTAERPPERIASQKVKAMLCVAVVLATLAIYSPIAHNQFTNFDDDVYIVNNPHVRAGLTWQTVKWAFTTFYAANWHPLAWLSHALDWQMFGASPVGPHYENVLLHAASAILLLLLLEGANGAIWPALAVAALFAAQPVNVESVAWAAERKNVLSMVFFLWTLLAYGWYARRGGVQRYAAVASLFALGLMAKSEIITLPFVLLLWDYWPLERFGKSQKIVVNSALSGSSEKSSGTGPNLPRSFWGLFLEKLPLMALAAASGVLTMMSQSASHAVRTPTLWVRFGNAVVAYVRYMGKAFWPARLAVLYPHPGALPAWEVLSAGAALLAITGLVLVHRDRRYLVTGWFWFLGTLVPVIGVVQVGVQAMADRYAYIPFIGLFICVAWGVSELSAPGEPEGAVPSSRLAVLGVGGLAALVALGFTTRQQVEYWRDSETLWRHTLAVTERNYMAHDELARAFEQQSRVDEAMAEHREAEKLGAYSSAEMLRVGVFEQTHGRVQDAVAQYGRALNAATDGNGRASALAALATAFLQMGDEHRAALSYGFALRENPDNNAALVGSALLDERTGDLASATAELSHAAQVAPTDINFLLLERALRNAGRSVEAETAHAGAQQTSKDLPAAERAVAQILAAAHLAANESRQ